MWSRAAAWTAWFDGMCHAVIEKVSSPASTDDLFRQAAVDATMLQDRIMTETGVTVGGEVAALALANALIAVVQEYLEQTSDEYDLDLFLEVNARQPDDFASWPVTILAGLRMRRTPPEGWRSICDRAVETAVRQVRSS